MCLNVIVMPNKEEPSMESTEKKHGADGIVELVTEIMNPLVDNSFSGEIKDLVSNFKKSLEKGDYSYTDYVAAESQLSSKTYKGTSKHIYEKDILTIIKRKQTGVRLSKVIGDRLKKFSKDFNSKDKITKKRIYDIVENNQKTKSKMINLTVKTLDKVEQDLLKLYKQLSNREGLE